MSTRERRVTAPASPERSRASLLDRLMVELFQTEQSAREHPQVEAQRLGDVAPARALRAVTEHASRALSELEALARDEGFSPPQPGVGRTIGQLFSLARRAVFDRMIDREKTYRGTLLGMRHGVDLVILVGAVARCEGRHRVAAFCDRWLETRVPLVDHVAAQLAWFAEHPRSALAGATSPRLAST